MDNFDEYLRQGEPNKTEKAKVWKTAIGLQQVDGLKPSEYLITTAKQNIEGDITIEEVKLRIDSYYKQHPVKDTENRIKNIHATKEFLLRFLGNLLLGENNILKNREMHIQFLESANNPVNKRNDPVNDPVKQLSYTT